MNTLAITVVVVISIIAGLLIGFLYSYLKNKQGVAPIVRGDQDKPEPTETKAEDEEIDLLAMAREQFAAADGSPFEKAKRTIAVIRDERGMLDDDDLFEILAELGKCGLSVDSQAAIAYAETELDFGEALDQFSVRDAKAIASFAKSAEIDLCSDDSAYSDLRDDCDFNEVASILKEFGADLKDIVAQENSYSAVEEEDVEELVGALSGLGFPKTEILAALNDNSEISTGVLTAAAADLELVATSDIVDFLVATDVSLEDLDEELGDLDVDTEKRIEILWGLMQARQRRNGLEIVAEKEAVSKEAPTTRTEEQATGEGSSGVIAQ